MNHIPKFLYKKRHPMTPNHKSKGPKLERLLAVRYVDYEPSSPSSSDSSSTSSSLRTRSLDLAGTSSFRIQGNDGELDLICQTLGLSGPEDFGIPVEDWEERKLRSVSGLPPRSRFQDETAHGRNDPVVELSDRFKDSIRVSEFSNCELINEFSGDNSNQDAIVVGPSDCCRTRDGIEGIQPQPLAAPPWVSSRITGNTSSNWNISGDVGDNGPNDHCRTKGGILGVRPQPLAAPSSISPQIVDNKSSMWDINTDGNNGGGTLGKCAIVGSVEYSSTRGGIKGVRPPLLAPPPSASRTIIDYTSSTWDIMRSFAPNSDMVSSSARGRSSYSDEEEGREVRTRGSTSFLSESYSFTTTSNDDDSSSTTTEPMSNISPNGISPNGISPNGRLTRIITHWQKGELLGRGSFGSVYEGIADGGYFIAIKEVSLLDQGDMGRQSIYQLEQEISLLSQFEHENIVQYYGTDKDGAHLYIFLELVTKGSLLSLYRKYHLRDSQVSSYTRQILHGLKYLHERNVVHRDIKCANILVGADGSVKLADFGLAKATKLNDVKSCKGTAFWMAPEVVRGRNQGYGLSADIWSLGCTVLEMLTHQIPYSPLECMQALFKIGRGEPPPIPVSLSKDARDFISRCLKVNPNDRPTATQLLDHPFVKRLLSTSSGSSSPYHFTGQS